VTKKLTLRDKQVLEVLVETRDWRKAIIQAYDYSLDDAYLKQKVHNVKARLLKKTQLDHFLEAHDLGHRRLASKLDELLEASKSVSNGTDETGAVRTVDKPDYQIQIRALDLLAEISGAKQKQKSHTIGTQVNQLIVETQGLAAAKETAKQIELRYGKDMINPDYKVEESRGE
jgi:hypothetical protein